MPRDAHSSRFSSDLAKRLPIPIFHVNAEGPDVVARVGKMALEYRNEFASPVVVDLIGFRRHGHSEVDDPTITQSLRYRKIEAHPPLWKIYAEKIGMDAEPIAARVHEELDAAQKEAQEKLAHLVPNAKHITDTNSGHEKHKEQPQLVIDAIRQVVDAVRVGRQLAR